MTVRQSTRPAWAEVSRSALRTNYATLRAQSKPINAEIVAVIKANAYGHGAAEALATIAAAGCDWFAVTCLEEALALPSQLNHRMLLLSGLFVGEAAEAIHRGFTPVLGSLEQLAWLSQAIERAPASSQPYRLHPFRFHLEIDTGMARQGIQWNDAPAFAAFAALLARYPQLQLEGVMTHFASPEDEQSSQTSEQVERFRTVLATLRSHGCAPALIHAGNSASLFRGAQTEALHNIAQEYNGRLLLRPGIALYGYGPYAAARGMQPVLSWKTRITALRSIESGEAVSYNATFRAARPTRIALLPVGYADGYNRLQSNNGEVLVHGRRAPIAGRVTMDQTMIDVTDVPNAAVGDEVILIGKDGEQRITADDIAARTGTIAYEVLCAIGTRVPRSWKD